MATALMTPPAHCARCPRLVDYRTQNQRDYPDYFNAPVPPFSDTPAKVRLLIVGLAPGLKGANRTGRPFTGDYAGELLYETLISWGFAKGCYGVSPDDGLRLHECRIINAVRCLPPKNKPSTQEIRACNPFLRADIQALPALQVIVALGVIAHQAVLQALGERHRDYRFCHGSLHRLSSGLTLADSYHCSRYNTSTKRLTPSMFNAVFGAANALLTVR